MPIIATPAVSARTAELVLGDTAEMLWPALAAAVRRLPMPVRTAAEAHFGWTSHDTEARPSGKAVRPALTLLCCRALGGRAEAALPAAVAVELVHNATLIHDDIIDGDELRRGRAALWREVGMPGALLTGDALFFLAVQVLGRAAPVTATVELADTIQTLIRGEYGDVLLAAEPGATVHDAEDVADAKTGALFACACRLGALAAGADRQRAAHLAAFGADLGRAFQLADDLLGIWGDPRRTGKPVGADLRARKKSLPVVRALAAGGPVARDLAALLGRPEPLTDEQVGEATVLLDRLGARRLGEQQLTTITRRAEGHLAAAAPDPVAARELAGLAAALIPRTA
ncbi:polyprenyl synthetase family protein [Actinoplanes sp. CA-131856]